MEAPEFNEDALASLSSKIHAKLSASTSAASKDGGKANKQAKPKTKSPKDKSKGLKSAQEPKHQAIALSEKAQTKQKPAARQSIAPSGKAQTKQKHAARQSNQQADTESKKHLRNGNLKSKDQPPKEDIAAPSSDRSRLLNEIIELGGTEDDLKLVQDVESGSELEQAADEGDPKLKKELRNLVQELGISKIAPQASSSEEEGSETSEQGEDDALESSMGSKTPNSALNQTAGSSRLLVEPRGEWHSADLPSLPVAQITSALSQDLVEKLHRRGKDLLKSENDAYGATHKASSSHQFYLTIMTSGTLTDKISALTLSVQESPLHNVRAFESLLALAKKRSRAQAIEVLNALKDLFAMGTLLPSNRHLRAFIAQPELRQLSGNVFKFFKAKSEPPKPLTDAHLLLWAYEDWLKTKYFEVLQILETWLSDEILFSRLRATDMAFELLREKPEQEANLLRLLVNKLGDTEKKVASKASYNILQLQIPHPSMASNIIKVIESDILFRPGQNLHAKYYAMITLNQTALSSKDESTVRKILDIYFAMFLTLLKSEQSGEHDLDSGKNAKGEIQRGGGKPGRMSREKKLKAAQKGASADDAVREKIMSAVLTGINRAIPFADTTDEFFERHLDTLFRVTHSANFNTSIQSLMLIQQLCESHPSASDRFYRTLYESLLDARLLNSSKQVLYLNLLYRALRADLNVKRVQAFVKRLLQCIAMHQPAFACGVLFLLRELETQFPGLALLIDQPEESPSDNEEGGNDGENTATDQSKITVERYDGKKRAPEHSHADRTCLWELDAFLDHFHPSVSLFANRLMSHQPMPPKPDLDSHTLIHFLDRFVYRNPKKLPDRMHGASLMQPLAAGDPSGLLLAPTGSRSEVPVNSEAFLRLRDDKVKADEVFFHKYFNTKAKSHEAAKSKKDKRRGPTDDSDDGEEDEIWQALVDSRPEIEDDDADMDDALDMDDFSDLEGSEPMSDMEGEEDDDDDESIGVVFDDEEDEEDEDEEAADEPKPTEAKLSNAKNEAAKKRRKYLRGLPMFASVDDYAGMMDNVEGEEVSP